MIDWMKLAADLAKGLLLFGLGVLWSERSRHRAEETARKKAEAQQQAAFRGFLEGIGKGHGINTSGLNEEQNFAQHLELGLKSAKPGDPADLAKVAMLLHQNASDNLIFTVLYVNALLAEVLPASVVAEVQKAAFEKATKAAAELQKKRQELKTPAA